MVSHDRFFVADPGQNALPAAGESCKEMRLDEALGNQQVAFQRRPVHHQLRARRQNADRHIVPLTVMDKDRIVPVNLVAQLFPQLLWPGSPVAAGRHQQRHLDLRIAGFQFFQHRRQDVPARDRPRMVADENDRRPLSRCQLPQCGRRNGPLHRLPDEHLPRLPGRQSADPRRQDFCCSSRQLRPQAAAAIGNSYFHSSSRRSIQYSIYCIQSLCFQHSMRLQLRQVQNRRLSTILRFRQTLRSETVESAESGALPRRRFSGWTALSASHVAPLRITPLPRCIGRADFPRQRSGTAAEGCKK